ncbi:MAG: hypothetical protein HXY40_08685 [Chloroflexi bacterium]|nr:hypothetical protein [Chloroflexota bacterium]
MTNIASGRNMMRRWPYNWLLLAALLYAPLLFLGYGADIDAQQVIDSGVTLMNAGRYSPSRYPGYVVHEIPTAVLNQAGGAPLANLGTLAMALWALYSFARLLEYYALPQRALLMLLLLTHPVYWTNAAVTLDYLWALALLLFGWRCLLSGGYGWAGLALGLAIGARLSSGALVALLLLMQFISLPGARWRLIGAGLLTLLLALLFYLPTLLTLGLLSLYFGDWNSIDYLLNFFYGNLLFFGPQLFFAAPFLLVLARRFRPRLTPEQRRLLWLCLAVIAAYEALFLRAPLEAEYLLPLLPALLLVLGLRLPPRLLWLWLALQFSSNFLHINLSSLNGNYHSGEDLQAALFSWGSVSWHGQSTELTWGLFVRWGYLLTDALNRLRGALSV